MLVVFVGSGLVWRITRQTPDILPPTQVAETTAPAAAMPAPAGDLGAAASRSERPTASEGPPRTAPAGAAAPAPSATAIVADAAPAVAGGSAASVETQALRAAESAAPPLPSVMVPRVVAKEDSTVIVGREQRRSASDVAAAVAGAAAAPSAPAMAMAKAERRRAAPGIAGLGERCVEASIFNPPQGWPARIALEPTPLGNGQSIAFAQFNGPVAVRWIGAGWRRSEGGSVEVAPVQVVGTLLLSSTDAKSVQGVTVGVLWGPCTTRPTGEM